MATSRALIARGSSDGSVLGHGWDSRDRGCLSWGVPGSVQCLCRHENADDPLITGLSPPFVPTHQLACRRLADPTGLGQFRERQPFALGGVVHRVPRSVLRTAYPIRFAPGKRKNAVSGCARVYRGGNAGLITRRVGPADPRAEGRGRGGERRGRGDILTAGAGAQCGPGAVRVSVPLTTP